MSIDVFDVLALAGVLLIAVGLWWVYPPLALIISGIWLFAAAVYGSQRMSGS